MAAQQIGPLRLRWEKKNDQFGHIVEVEWSDMWIPLLASRDELQEGQIPRSPPVQELERPAEGLALAVGMAGKNHWSMSVQNVTPSDIDFDVACRVHERPIVMGSTYRELSAKLVTCDARGARWRMEHAAGGSMTPFTPCLTLSCQAGTVEHDGDLRIRPDIALMQADLPVTIRWRYLLRLTPEGQEAVS